VFDKDSAMATVRKLAGEIGPREATSLAYRQAAAWVQNQFGALGYDVRRQSLHVPAGVSWGVPVGAGRTWNVIARPRNLRPGEPYVVVGAHLDTVPQAPGAEDNASGVGVVLEMARLAAIAPTRLPVVFVAFAAEEPRGTGDDRHHYGSRALVARLSAVQRTSLRGVVALDRVGVGQQVPICNGRTRPTSTTRSLRQSAKTLGVTTRSCGVNRSSDHWSFELAGLSAARIGSTPYAAYHSAGDRPQIVEPAQLDRVGRVLWQWLRD
jgi:Peptidase family M28